ncbi:BA14K family protein [Sphingopyxis sp.]|uniref:BA14K family protein n=1 Tax=Sphingopyxis sp. TaxID=1908224 RepID=UPI003D0C32F9
MNIRHMLAGALTAVGLAMAPQVAAQGRPQAGHQQTPPKKETPKADTRFGQWNSGWGAKPPAPPKHFTKQGEWYRHVRACQVKFRSYNPRTDTYRASGNRTLRCRL